MKGVDRLEFEGVVHGRSILITRGHRPELNGRTLRLVEDTDLEGTASASLGEIEASALVTLERLLSLRRGPFVRLRSRCGGAVSEPGFKAGKFLGAGRKFFSAEVLRLRAASEHAEAMGLDPGYVERLEEQILHLRDHLTGSTFPDAFVHDTRENRWLALELKVLREGCGVRELMIRGTAGSDWPHDDDLSLALQIANRASALPATFAADDPSSDEQEEVDLPVKQALVLDVRCLPGGSEGLQALHTLAESVLEELRLHLRPGSIGEALSNTVSEVFFLHGPRNGEQVSASYSI